MVTVAEGMSLKDVNNVRGKNKLMHTAKMKLLKKLVAVSLTIVG